MLNAEVLLQMRYSCNFRSIQEYKSEIALVGVYEAVQTPFFAPLILLVLHEDGEYYLDARADTRGIENIMIKDAQIIAKCMGIDVREQGL